MAPLDGRDRWANPSVSTDGSHILMATHSTPSSSSPVRLYMRVSDSVTYEVTRGGYGTFIGTTSDGNKVYFTSSEQLTTDDHDRSDDLYMWSEEGDTLTRLSKGAEGGEVGDIDACSAEWTSQCSVEVVTGGREQRGFVSISDYPIARGSGDVYFYSPELLAGPAEGSQDAQNLYVYRDGAVHFVLRLPSDGSGALSRFNVTADGTYAAFISKGHLTTYENNGLSEMYRYTPDTGRIACMSCLPDGAPPTREVTTSSGGLFLAADGRTFFATEDALVPRDTDQLYSVYEYVSGRPQLISSGTSIFNSRNKGAGNNAAAGELFGITANGENVYFSTYDTLVPQDHNGAFLKFYDARTGGGFPVADRKRSL